MFTDVRLKVGSVAESWSTSTPFTEYTKGMPTVMPKKEKDDDDDTIKLNDMSFWIDLLQEIEWASEEFWFCQDIVDGVTKDVAGGKKGAHGETPGDTYSDRKMVESDSDVDLDELHASYEAKKLLAKDINADMDADLFDIVPLGGGGAQLIPYI